MLCEHCGKEIPKDSKFCRYCGQPVTPHATGAKVSRLPLILAALLVCVVLVLGIRQSAGFAKPTGTASAASFGVQGQAPTPVKPPELSEYETKMANLHSSISDYARQMLAGELSNPDSLKLTHNWKALTNEGVFITHSGTAEYLNRNGMQTTQPYKVTMVLSNGGNHAFCMALVLGDTVVYDNGSNLDATGKIVRANTSYGDKTYGEQIFDSITNPDLWEKGPAVSDAPKALTLADYLAIDIGMTYDQTCKILGSSGVEISRSGSGRNEILTVVWIGPDAPGSNISVIFIGGRVDSKAQLGLQ